MLIHAIAHGGVRTHVKESALKVDSGRKIPCRTGESNRSVTVRWSNQLSNILLQTTFFFFFLLHPGNTVFVSNYSACMPVTKYRLARRSSLELCEKNRAAALCVCAVLKKNQKNHRRRGMNGQTFSQNPRKRGKSHHHLSKSSLSFCYISDMPFSPI